MPSSSPADRRHQHRPLDAELIEPFLARCAVVRSRLLDEGRSNSNYDLILDDGTHCVLRLHARPMAKVEAFVTGLVRGRVPVQALLHCGEDWSAWEFMDGRPMRDEPGEVRAAAAALARIWEAKFESPGEIRADGSTHPWTFGDGAGFMVSMLAHPDVSRYLGDELLQGVARLLEERRSPEVSAEPHLVHG